MKKTLTACLVLATVLLFGSGRASAAGMGFSVGFGGGSGTVEYDIPGTEEIDVDASSFGLSFLLETDPLSAESFSYRLNIGIEALNLEDDSGVTAELGGLVFDNTFCFRLAGDDTYRIWIGPQVRVGFYGGETDKEFLGETIEYSAFAFGVGGAIGGNWSMGGDTIIGFDTGIRFTGYGGEAEWGGVKEDFTASTSIFFVNFDMMWESK